MIANNPHGPDIPVWKTPGPNGPTWYAPNGIKVSTTGERTKTLIFVTFYLKSGAMGSGYIPLNCLSPSRYEILVREDQ